LLRSPKLYGGPATLLDGVIKAGLTCEVFGASRLVGAGIGVCPVPVPTGGDRGGGALARVIRASSRTGG
jgi:hypothetical protein